MKTPISLIDRQLLSCSKHELSIVLGDTAYDNLNASLRQAALLAASAQYDSVIYINLPFSRNRFTAAERAQAGSDSKKIHAYHVSGGRLAESLRSIGSRVADGSRTAIIINSWEMSSACYRYREDLVFALQELVLSSEATVIVYGQSKPESVSVAKPNRTGLGKLTIFADAVISLKALAEIEEEEATFAKQEEQEHSDLEVTADGVFAQLPSQQINDLATPDGHLSGGEFGEEEEVVEDGVLEYA